MHAEDQHASVGLVRQNAAHCLDTAGSRQGDIHDHDLRPQAAEQRVGTGGIFRLTD